MFESSSPQIIEPREWRKALHWIHFEDRGNVEANVDSSLAQIENAGRDVFFFGIPNQESWQAAGYAYVIPGKVGVIGGIRLASLADNEPGSFILRGLLKSCATKDVEIVQAVATSFSPEVEQLFQSHDFQHLATMDHLLAARPKSSRSWKRPEEIDFGSLRCQRFEYCDREQLEQLLSRTYIDTLDCPALGPARSLSATLDGYIASSPDFSNWWILWDRAEMAGCFLGANRGELYCELIYLGLGPNYRKQGLASKLVELGMGQAWRSGVSQVVAGVDKGNIPAQNLYQSHAFVPFQTVEVWFLPLRRSASKDR